MKKIIIASDHGAVALKEQIVSFLKTRGCEIKDMGVNAEDSVDYPDIAVAACREFLKGGYDFGILLAVQESVCRSLLTKLKESGVRGCMIFLLRKWPKPIIMPISFLSAAG